MEAALREFGIEDPTVNTIARREDPDMVVERVDEEEETSVDEDQAEVGQDILSEVVEAPPEEERRRSVGAPPPVPPRRTPKLGSEEHKETVESKEEAVKDGETVKAQDEEERKEGDGEKMEGVEEKKDGGPGEGENKDEERKEGEHHS